MSQAHTPSGQDAAPWIILGVVGLATVAFAVVWLGGTLGALAGGAGWAPPPFTVDALTRFLASGPAGLWPQAAPGWVWVGIASLALGATGAGTAAALILRARLAGPAGLARRRDLPGLLARGVAERARTLRPSLAGVDAIPADAAGLLLGDLDPNGPELRACWEDIVLAIMAPRAGKSTALAAPAILRAPGAVLLTSNKADVYTVTKAARQRAGRLWIFDPQGITHSPRELWWDMLAEAVTIEGARRLAGHFIASITEAARRDFWSSAALNLLTALFHAAAVTGGTVTDVLAWLANSADRSPVDALRSAGMQALADQLQGTQRGALDTREGIYETARQAVACLLDPAVAAWVTPDEDVPQFRPAEFVACRNTLYLLSKDGGGSAAGVIASAADAVMRAAVAAGERAGGRLDPPLVAVLDEAANVCRIADLPDLYSHLGSRGVIPITILQSYQKGVGVWGEIGMDALWSAATIKLLGAGLDDADFAEKIARLVGDHKVTEHSVSRGASGRSVSVSQRREQVLPVSEVRALPKGRALLLATGLRPALIRLRPWYSEPDAAELAAAAKAETAAITQRAAVTLTKSSAR